jgi:hypothetical protein
LWVPHVCLAQRQTGQLTVGRNITLTLVLSSLFHCKSVFLWSGAQYTSILMEIPEHFEGKVLRMITEAPWYVPNMVL